MSFDMNPKDDDIHGECRHEIKQLTNERNDLILEISKTGEWERQKNIDTIARLREALEKLK